MIPTAQDTAPGNSGGGVRRFLITGLVIVLVAVASSVTTYLLTRDTDDSAGQRAAATATPTPSATTAGPEYFSVHGTMTVEADYWDGVGEECTTGGGYDDIRGGAAVIIRADDGATLGKGVLIDGIGGTDFFACEFAFHVHEIPAGKAFYKVEVSHRGELTFTEDELREDIALTL